MAVFGGVEITNSALLRSLTPEQRAEFERLAQMVPSEGFSLGLNRLEDLQRFISNPASMLPAGRIRSAFVAASKPVVQQSTARPPFSSKPTGISGNSDLTTALAGSGLSQQEQVRIASLIESGEISNIEQLNNAISTSGVGGPDDPSMPGLTAAFRAMVKSNDVNGLKTFFAGIGNSRPELLNNPLWAEHPFAKEEVVRRAPDDPVVTVPEDLLRKAQEDDPTITLPGQPPGETRPEDPPGTTRNPITGAITTNPVVEDPPIVDPVVGGGPVIDPVIDPVTVTPPVTTPPPVIDPVVTGGDTGNGPLVPDLTPDDLVTRPPQIRPNPVTQAAETQLVQGIPNLGFDEGQVRDARTTGIERNNQESLERLGRIFGISPTGLQSGRAIRIGGTVEAQRLQNLENLEAELANRGSAEQRANLQTLSNIALGDRGTGLAEQQFETGVTGQFEGANTVQEQQRLFGNQVTTAGLTGEFQGAQTVQDQQRAFQNMLAEAQLFGETRSQQFIGREAFAPAMGKSQGEAGYDERIDLNSDGTISTEDYMAFLETGTTGAGPNGEFGIQAQTGRDTLAQQQLDSQIDLASQRLGLDRDVFDEGVNQFAQQFSEHQIEFRTQATGFVFERDAEGNLTPVGMEREMETVAPNTEVTWNGEKYLTGLVDADGVHVNAQNLATGVTTKIPRNAVVAGPMTTLERDNFNRVSREFTDRMNFDMNRLIDKFNIDAAQMDSNFWGSVIGAVGTIGGAAVGFATAGPAGIIPGATSGRALTT